jgi:hypothetical protein
MKLTKVQRHYLDVMILRGTLKFGWGGYRSTQVVRALEERGLAIVRVFPVSGSTGFHWTAQATRAGRAALASLASGRGR